MQTHILSRQVPADGLLITSTATIKGMLWLMSMVREHSGPPILTQERFGVILTQE